MKLLKSRTLSKPEFPQNIILYSEFLIILNVSQKKSLPDLFYSNLIVVVGCSFLFLCFCCWFFCVFGGWGFIVVFSVLLLTIPISVDSTNQ